MSTILLIDDDASLSNLLAEYLREQGYVVHVAGDGQKGLRVFFEQKPDLVILDVTMPKMDGWETLKHIREMSRAPVIMLTARDEEPNVLRGFSLGADDYVTKPFSFAQLGARVKAVLGRAGGAASSSERLEVGGLQVDFASRRVTRDGEPIPLTPTEFKLLTVLMRRPGEVISAEELVREVWGPQYANEIGFVRRYVWHLRQKVERDPENPQYIHNERGFGYRFQVEA
ncbi:MAG: response regulator transcription factor [Chloroflexota bacterium]|nr:response regulator transcription factor [Chloroflexota bacterium]MBI5703320.1 response regulator transcription factor [Chloroflexota bacterium]